ncbi:MAG: TRAP transporter substrate-binding protein [Spirochaetota bacterium]
MKRFVFLVAVLFCAVGMVGFAGGQQEAAEEGAAAQEEPTVYQFKYAHTQSSEHPRSESMEYFKEQIEKLSDGRIEVELFFGGTMGTEAEVVDMVKTGNIQGMRGGSWQKANPKYFIYALPFMFEDPYQAGRAMDSEIGQKINEGAMDNGLYVPACGVAGGARQITNNVRPIRSIDDLKGLKLRTPPIGVIVRSFKAFGANPQEVPYTETYMALKTGVVDGQENPFSNIYDMKFYEPQKYLSVVNWEVHPDPLYVNPDWYAQLPGDLQAIFDSVSKDALRNSNKIWLGSEAEFLRKMEDQIEVNTVPKENLKGFIDAGKEVYQYYVDEGYFTWDEINQVREAAGLAALQ